MALLFSASMFVPSSEAKAQTVSLISTTNSLPKDTVTNTAAKQWVTTVKGYQATIGIQVDVAKLTGTLAGTLIPIASLDGVTYYAAGTGTMTITDVAAQGILFAPPLGYNYYGVRWTGSGTMTGTLVAKLIARKTSQ